MSNSFSQQIDRGVAIVAQIAVLEKELEAIEEALRTHAKAHPDLHIPLGDAEREGRQFLAEGAEFTVPVLFTADKIVGSFAAKGDKHIAISAKAGEHFGKFFKPVSGYENRFDDGKKFRDRADELLGEDAPGFVTICKALDKFGIPKHDVKIEWKEAMTAKKVEELGAEVRA
ncbi:MAG: hypothetical protein P4L99_21850 [Chthoniobacter sp.]|nr:hypothetical protein [Chthoniobacter sp.]